MGFSVTNAFGELQKLLDFLLHQFSTSRHPSPPVSSGEKPFRMERRCRLPTANDDTVCRLEELDKCPRACNFSKLVMEAVDKARKKDVLQQNNTNWM